MAKGLTKRQEEILVYIVEYIESIGYPPSIREIGAHFGIKSLRGVTVHLDALETKGYIKRGATPRSINVIHPAYQTSGKKIMLPLYGNIAAGGPIYTENHIEDYIAVPSDMVKNIKDPFLLRIKGDSMVGDGIMPKDIVVIKPQQVARQGDIVAFQLGDDATVKHYYSSGDQVKLVASNPAYEDIYVRQENARIIGKVVGLLRDYEGMAF